MRIDLNKIMLTALLLSLVISPVLTDNGAVSRIYADEIDEGVEEYGSELFADTVRVGLKYGSSAANSYTISSENGFYVAEITDGTVYENLPVTAYSSVTLSYEGGVVVLKGDDGNVIIQDFGTSVLLPLDYADGGTITANGNKYRGGITVSRNSSGSLNLINVLNTEHYVYGVLDSEMYHDNPLEALKAQAVAARSFAKLNLGRHGDYGFDLCTSTHCQVYKGYSDEYEETNRAVDETAGLCMYYNGEPVSAYYYKNSGGYTQNIKDVWGSSLGYLKAVEDPYSPEYPWTVTYTFDELESKLSSAGNSIGELKSVEIVSRNESGAVDTLKFTGASGTTTLSKEKIRTFFGSTVIKSTMFSFKDAESTSAQGENPNENNSSNAQTGNGKLSVLGADGLVVPLESNRVSVISAGNAVSSIDLEDAYITNGENTVSAASYFDEEEQADNRSDSDDSKNGDGVIAVSEYVTTSPVTFVGKGYGHGIGMPQDSAIEMAKQGFAFDEILQYYYTDIEIR